MYLTPSRFRQLGLGTDVTSLSDAELAAILTRASERVNRYCCVPMLPQPYDFRGGTVTGEQHRWTLGTDIVRGTRRVYPWHQPVKSVTQMKIQVTNLLYVTINGTDVVIDNTEGYLEVVSLASIMLGIFPIGIVPNLGLVVPIDSVDYTYGYEITVAGEQMYAIDTLTFQAEHFSWAPTPAPVVYKNGAALTVTTDYAVNSADGTVTFTNAPASTDVITVDYTYTLPQAIGEATALIAQVILNERSLQSKSMGGLVSLRVEELEAQRPHSRSSAGAISATADLIPPAAQELLDPFIFRTVTA